MSAVNTVGAAKMDKRILDILNDFASWRGNSFTLATLVAEKQRQICEEEAAKATPEPETPEGE